MKKGWELVLSSSPPLSLDASDFRSEALFRLAEFHYESVSISLHTTGADFLS